ncbi:MULTISPECIES: nuclear transport factor 2 family protein [unclassified Crossiella]|uniref:YybH family protein n=1 Tax=unclassified Crossiella TaxID=2620835 RepID=UPI002000442A|nr:MULTISPECIES: nuclear transport factor 2 family protein [unclassified Crossiella]MCK2244514.1 nuclear transport factor 2 family protein [Crossiella sp. S99.2]MCK2258145.1 nuclear transport factor 2 family protein [Crossiella sp. S99.1]
MTDEAQIRDLIQRWATAVHAADLPAVLADHAPGIVMFDVPPPEQGVRGLDAYRDSWPGFFQWQSGGALFEIESLEVTAGAEVAFAFALLRCGTPADFERDPDRRLRLTLGLTKTGDRWSVTHEHHSFTDPSTLPEIAATEVRAVHEQWSAQTAAKDLDGLMAAIAPDIVSYEHAGPLEYVGIDAVREVCRHGLESSPERITFDTPDLTVRVDGDLAVSWGIDRIVTDGVEDRSRGTRVFQRRDGGWQLIHQHLSHPEK